MGKILSPREYDIRSLAYYQAEGGVYNDIITILTKMRSEPEFRGLPSPAKSLNEACFLYDMKQQRDLDLEEEKKYISEINGDLSKVLVAVMATAWEEVGFCIAYERLQIIGDKNPYLPKFDEVFEKYMNQEMEARNAYGDGIRILDLEDELKAKENLLATANAKIDELQKLVDSLKVRNESKYDKTLNRKDILAYVESQRVYTNVNQIFEMLLYMSRVATDEEYNEIVALRQKMIDACVPTVHNHNDIQNSNVFPGLVSSPSFPIGTDPEELVRKALEQILKSQKDGEEG